MLRSARSPCLRSRCNSPHLAGARATPCHAGGRHAKLTPATKMRRWWCASRRRPTRAPPPGRAGRDRHITVRPRRRPGGGRTGALAGSGACVAFTHTPVTRPPNHDPGPPAAVSLTCCESDAHSASVVRSVGPSSSCGRSVLSRSPGSSRPISFHQFLESATLARLTHADPLPSRALARSRRSGTTICIRTWETPLTGGTTGRGRTHSSTISGPRRRRIQAPNWWMGMWDERLTSAADVHDDVQPRPGHGRAIGLRGTVPDQKRSMAVRSSIASTRTISSHATCRRVADAIGRHGRARSPAAAGTGARPGGVHATRVVSREPTAPLGHTRPFTHITYGVVTAAVDRGLDV
jgi:hypothetical protein